MAKRMTIMLIIAAIVFGGAVAWYFVKQQMIAKFLAKQKYPPATVNATMVKTSNWQPFYDSVGTFVAPQSVSLKPEVDGIVTNIYFKSGDIVHKRQVLVQLSDRSQRTQLLKDQAGLTLARLNYQRNLKLYHQRAVSRQAMDTSLATMQQDKAAMLGDQVAIDQKKIRAPFSGRIGIREVNLGQYINTVNNSGNVVIGTLEQVDPLYIDFSLAQQYVHNLKVGQPIEITVDAYANKVFKGKIAALAVGVNKDSRMITVRALVPNKRKQLYSGMFANVRVLLPQHRSVVTVPQTAITYNLYGDLVYVVNKGRAVQTFVTVGQRRGNDIEILKGLKVGQQIVTAGQLKLFNGAPVIVSKKAELR